MNDWIVALAPAVTLILVLSWINRPKPITVGSTWVRKEQDPWEKLEVRVVALEPGWVRYRSGHTERSATVADFRMVYRLIQPA
jgi:hypothetical protein